MLVARALHGLLVAHGSSNAGSDSRAKLRIPANECREQTIDVLLNVRLVKGDAGFSCRLTWSSTGGRIVADYTNQASQRPGVLLPDLGNWRPGLLARWCLAASTAYPATWYLSTGPANLVSSCSTCVVCCCAPRRPGGKLLLWPPRPLSRTSRMR